jgi:prevent-host-death family protein
MNMIRPVSDLRNNFADISKTVHETAQPVFLTKNGYGDMVVLSMEAFENLLIIYAPLRDFGSRTKRKFFSQKGRKSGGKRGCAEGCGNVVNL